MAEREKLASRCVHVWVADVEAIGYSESRLRKTLDASELEKVARLQREVDRIRYIVAHAMLRELLTRYLGVEDARRIRITGGQGRRPELKWPYRATGLRFSLSYSGQLAVMALSRFVRVGIDVQWTQDSADAQDTRLWVRGEAAVKALGLGVDHARYYEVEGDPPIPMRRPDGTLEGLVIHDLDVSSPDHLVAVAAPPLCSIVNRGRWLPQGV